MLLAQEPYRKKVRVGDVFALRYADGYVFGQVLAQNVPFAGFESCQHKVAVFAGIYPVQDDWKLATKAPLLIPPYHMNNLGFTRGFMVVVGNEVPVEIDSLKFCYQDTRGWFFDDKNQRCERRSMIGEYGFGNYLTLSDDVRRASNNSLQARRP